jgi:ABC-type transport system involved in multi-copper enzyme maturation permease subunit
MVWLPIVERELRVAARKRGTYRIRVLALLAVTTAFAWALFAGPNKTGFFGVVDGRELFAQLAYPAAIFSIFIGVFATSDCVGVEKREGTLGLLFLTDLKGYDVIFGKMVASSLNGFYALVAVLPVLGVPILAGGVRFSNFLALSGGLVAALLFSLSAGILVSTFQHNERKAMFMTFTFLAVISVAPFQVRGIARTVLSCFSPLYPVEISQFNLMGTTLRAYWCSLGVIWLMTFFMLSRASIQAPKAWQEKAVSAGNRPASLRSQARQSGRVREDNPFAWLAARGEADPRLVWFFLGSILAIWLFFLLLRPAGLKAGDMFGEGVVNGCDMVVGAVLKLWIISEASRRFAEDRGSGAFELMLTTPLTAEEIIEGQWTALWRRFGWPMLAVAAWDVFLGMGMTGGQYYSGDSRHWLALLFLFADALALCFAGMWLGLWTRSRNRSILGGVLLVLTLPWLVSAAINSFANVNGTDTVWSDLTVWGLADAAVICCTAPNIILDFRKIATEGWTQRDKREAN